MAYFYLRNPLGNIMHCQANAAWQDHVLDIADKSIGNTFIFSEKYEMERCITPVTFDESIDWDAVPFGDPEWCFAFNRHTFLLNNAKAAAITGNRKYRDNWIRLFEDFYTRSKLDETTENRSWRSLECGIRIENYIRSLEILSAAGMEPDAGTMEDIAAFFQAHINWLIKAHTDFQRISNWGVLQDHGLFLAALYIGQEKEMETALSRLDEEMGFQTLPDGMHWEQSTMYQAEVLHAALDTIMVAGRNGIEVPSGLRRNTELLAIGLARTLRPDGKCYLFGDSDEIDMRDLIASAAVIFDSGELSYYAQGGCDEEFWMSHELGTELPEPIAPKQHSFFMKDSGNAILRLSDETALRFHCGLIGSGHGHLDQLHFDLYDRGTAILTDTGRYTYVDTPERRALKGAYGHNTVILDRTEPSKMEDSWGVSSFAAPVFSDAVIEGPYKYLEASHMGYADKGAFITRSILTIGSRFVIIADDIRTTGKTDAEILFHFGEDTKLEKANGTFTACCGKSMGTLIPMSDTEASISSSGIAKRYNEMKHSPLLTLRSTVEGRKCFITVIAIGNGGFKCTGCPVIKPQTGTAVPDDISAGLMIEDGNDSYSVGIVTNEYPSGGFLLKAGNAEAYGRVFVRKNGERTAVVRY